MKRLLLTGTLAIMLAACTNQSPPQADNSHNPVQDRLFGVGPINYKWTRGGDGIRYSFDANQNPQSIRNLSDAKYSISDDQDKIRRIVESEGNLDPGMVAIIGDKAYVHVRVPQNVNRKDLKIDDLRDDLQAAMPRYDIRLIIDD